MLEKTKSDVELERQEGNAAASQHERSVPPINTGRDRQENVVPIKTTVQSNSVLSRIRLRNEHRPFSHPLEKEKTGLEVFVDFDGPEDPYDTIATPPRGT